MPPGLRLRRTIQDFKILEVDENTLTKDLINMIDWISGFLDLILIIQTCLNLINTDNCLRNPFILQKRHFRQLINELKAALYCSMRTVFFLFFKFVTCVIHFSDSCEI